MGEGRKRQPNHLAAIFVHAGAGFHSLQNEDIHLQACARAASMAMAALREGASALDAVELAIKSLEDNEITNAGYGSNLTLDGVVECDATIVDHHGRSGAVGAMTEVLNPIFVARKVLDASVKPLSLRRVAPNLLAGKGATDFAAEHGIPVVPPGFLVSANAHDRYTKWKHDLVIAKSARKSQLQVENREIAKLQEAELIGAAQSSDPVIAALANESQAFSPEPSTSRRKGLRSAASLRPATPHPEIISPSRPTRGGSVSDRSDTSVIDKPEPESLPSSPIQRSIFPWARRNSKSLARLATHDGMQLDKTEDDVVDTVGAIAIDNDGLIAAASSSGGIGMKHGGRIGPAALVGVGTAVLPADPDDTDECTTACVTSGTGEHMATTMAASTCARRLMTSKVISLGDVVVDVDENEALRDFVDTDCMKHPSVVHSNSPGAIGVMAVKKCRGGMWLYFAHNTDSFALASMSADDDEPLTVMSRTQTARSTTTGGRSIRQKRTNRRRKNKSSQGSKDKEKSH